ncbi:ribonuclease H-like domain-containing protein [Tanacetum coccineum]
MAIGDPFGSGSADLINNLDVGLPLFLLSNDNSSLSIVNFKLVGAENYKIWATTMKIALKGKNKIVFIDGTFVKQESSAVLSQEESYRGLHPSVSGNNKSQPAAFVVKTNKYTNNFNMRVNTNNINTNKELNLNLLCKNCGLIGHTVDRCYELIGYPAGFKMNPNMSKQAGNNKRFNGNSEVNQSLPTTSGSLSSSFTNKQMMKLLSLINEKSSPSANMSRNKT